jgi:Lanthionine-containing peptide SapB precursor RamS
VVDVSILDLQGMKMAETKGKAPAGSRASKGCGNTGGGTTQSNVSLLLCILVL